MERWTLITLIKIFCNKEGITFNCYGNEEVSIIKDGNEFVIKLETKVVIPLSQTFCVRYGETDLNDLFERLKIEESKHLQIIDKINKVLYMSEEEMKNYIVENIDYIES